VVRESNYTEAPLIVPIQQIPDNFDNRDWQAAGLPADAPFIVYDYLIPGGYDTDYWNLRDEIMLWIYDYDIDKIMEIKEALYDITRRFDLAATDINAQADVDSPFVFHYFDVMMGLPTDEADQVVGLSGVNLVLTYEYTRPILSNGRFA
jgi:hypothetical protein